ncbi:MAG: replication-relaxation family protein [Thermoanaerobaculia bacterium]
MPYNTPNSDLANVSGPPKDNNQETDKGSEALADAIVSTAQPTPVREGGQGTSTSLTHGPVDALRGLPQLPSVTGRDTDAVAIVMLLRLLSYDQLRRLVFPSQDGSVLRRRGLLLEKEGWLHSWDAPVAHGGRIRYVHPTRRALRWALDSLAARTKEEPWAPIVRLMLPRSGRKPLTLGEGTVPKWLPHQREVNHLVASIATSPGRRVLWASSWDCPFPTRAGMFTLPQPDYVLIEEREGVPRLIFGEHDRGTEPVERFIARKVELYASLARFPEACRQYFGLRSFEVHVSVIDTRTKAPIARLRALQAAAGTPSAPSIFRFTLGGWLNAFPDQAIWFTAAGGPTCDSVKWRDHDLLRT